MLDPEITLQCPGCSRKFKQKLSRLKTNAQVRCPGCGKAITIQGDGGNKAAAAIKRVEDAFKRLGRK